MVVTTLQPWAEISERPRRIVSKFQAEYSEPHCYLKTHHPRRDRLLHGRTSSCWRRTFGFVGAGLGAIQVRRVTFDLITVTVILLLHENYRFDKG